MDLSPRLHEPLLCRWQAAAKTTPVRHRTCSVYHGILSSGASMPTLESVVRSNPDVLGGTPVFAGTRVPVKNLLDYLAAGDSLDRFLDHFPSVTREQAVAALEIAKDLLTSRATPAR
jgi:uncharacterized protein (DUF433 family)